MAHVRQFDTGANREEDAQKFDYEGCLSPLVIERFGRYMHEKSFLADGSRRASDNWQLGIPKDEYIKSLLRHVVALWKAHRSRQVDQKTLDVVKEALCAIMFNSMGYLHETLRTPQHGPCRDGLWHTVDADGACIHCGMHPAPLGDG